MKGAANDDFEPNAAGIEIVCFAGATSSSKNLLFRPTLDTKPQHQKTRAAKSVVVGVELISSSDPEIAGVETR